MGMSQRLHNAAGVTLAIRAAHRSTLNFINSKNWLTKVVWHASVVKKMCLVSKLVEVDDSSSWGLVSLYCGVTCPFPEGILKNFTNFSSVKF